MFEESGKSGLGPRNNSPDPPLRTTGSSASSFTHVVESSENLDLPKAEQHIPESDSTKSVVNSGISDNDRDVEKQKTTTSGNAANDPSAYPDGGLEAWTVVLGAFCGLFVSFGWINCIGIFQNHYQLHQLNSYSPSTVAWIPSLETCMMFVASPICGKLFDNFGPRYLLLGGTFLHVFGLMMTSLSTEYYQFVLAQGICSAIGAGALFYPSMNSVATWFFKRRGLALGIATSGSSIGGVILPIMVQRLIPMVGFGWAMRASAFLILGMCIITNLTVKSRIPPRPTPFRFMDFVTPFKELPFLLTAFATFLFIFGIFLPFTFIILHARRYGMSEHLASYLVPILNAASTLGRMVPGWISDRIGRYNMMIIVSYFTSILVLALWIPAHSSGSIIAFTALYGFGSGGFVSLPPALVAQISDVRQIGIRTGAMFATASIGALVGNPIGGALVPDVVNGSFWKMQLFSGLVMAAGSTFFVFARVKVVGWKLTKKF